jgi:hypothetical protein
MQYDEQFNFSQDSEHFQKGVSAFPPDLKNIFLTPQEHERSSQKLLGFLRELAIQAQKGDIPVEDSFKDKGQMAQMLFPEFYDPSSLIYRRSLENNHVSDGTRVYDRRGMIKSDHKERVHKIISGIECKGRKTLRSLNSDEEKKKFLQQFSVLIRVDELEKGKFLWVYHGPGCYQANDLLRTNHELLTSHGEKQKAGIYLAKMLCGMPSQQLDLEFDSDIEGDTSEAM